MCECRGVCGNGEVSCREREREGGGGRGGGRVRIGGEGEKQVVMGVVKHVGDRDIEHVQHNERINVHRVSSINSIYSRSYGQHKIRGKIAILGHITG